MDTDTMAMFCFSKGNLRDLVDGDDSKGISETRE